MPFSDDFLVHRRRGPSNPAAFPVTPASGGSGSTLLNWSSGRTATYTMEVHRPKSTGLDSNDRIYAAYPGIEYNIGAAVYGGVPPFKYELTTNVPSGMTIDINTGEIIWPSPSVGTYSNIGFKCTDSVGTVVTSTWSITCATTRFRFFDAVNGNNAWDGTSATFVSGTTGPKQTMSAFWGIGSTTIIGYFLNGTYTNAGMTIQSDGIRWTTATTRPCIWLAYPGHSPLIDFEHVQGVNTATQWDFVEGSGTPRGYMDGLEFTRSGNKCLRMGPGSPAGDNFCIRRCYFHNFGPGTDGANSAAIDFESGAYGSGTADNFVLQDCEFSDNTDPSHGPNSAIKMYATNKMLIERCYFHDMDIAGEDEEAIANKAGNVATVVRGCWSDNMLMGTYGGNQDDQPTGACDAEVILNHFTSSVHCVRLNHNYSADDAGPTKIIRNTFEGGVIYNGMQSTQGPWEWTNNVVINNNAATDNPDGTGITFGVAPGAGISALTVSNHIFGSTSAGIVDASGLLTPAYEASRYYYGHQTPELA